jgi:hypothetical protein
MSAADRPTGQQLQQLAAQAQDELEDAWDIEGTRTISLEPGAVSAASDDSHTIQVAARSSEFHTLPEIVYEEVGHVLASTEHDRPHQTLGEEIVNEMFGALARNVRFDSTIEDDIDRLERWYRSIDGCYREDDIDQILDQTESYIRTLEEIRDALDGYTNPSSLLETIQHRKEEHYTMIDDPAIQPLPHADSLHQRFPAHVLEDIVFGFEDELSYLTNRVDLGKASAEELEEDCIEQAGDHIERTIAQLEDLDRDELRDRAGDYLTHLRQAEFPISHLLGYRLAAQVAENGPAADYAHRSTDSILDEHRAAIQDDLDRYGIGCSLAEERDLPYRTSRGAQRT